MPAPFRCPSDRLCGAFARADEPAQRPRMPPNAASVRGVADLKARRSVAVAVIRSLLIVSALLAVYFALPLRGRASAAGLVILTGGLLGFVALFAWQLRTITTSESPRRRAAEVLVISVAVYLLVFSAAYVLMDRTDPSAFSTPITQVGALYFSVTVLSTVGFGDITPISDVARLAVTVQMLGDLVFLGLGLRLLIGAVETGLARRKGTAGGWDPSAR